MSHQRSSSSSSTSMMMAGSSNGSTNSSVTRSARLERKTWIMALAIFTAVVCITGSAPYYLSTRSLVASSLSSPSSSSKKSPVFSQNRVNGSWEDEMRYSLGIDKCIKPEAKWVLYIEKAFSMKDNSLSTIHCGNKGKKLMLPWLCVILQRISSK